LFRHPAAADRLAGAAFGLIGGGAVFGAVSLEVGTPGAPEPGFFPFLAGVTLVLLSAVLALRVTVPSDTEPFGDSRAVLLAIGGLIVFVLTLDVLGYVLAAAALTAILLIVFGVRGIRAFAIVVPAAALGSYVLFDILLGIPLPAGPLGS
jgi:putative tricarboxylic transport membrane protein